MGTNAIEFFPILREGVFLSPDFDDARPCLLLRKRFRNSLHFAAFTSRKA
jgi:hypothetical protein